MFRENGSNFRFQEIEILTKNGDTVNDEGKTCRQFVKPVIDDLEGLPELLSHKEGIGADYDSQKEFQLKFTNEMLERAWREAGCAKVARDPLGAGRIREEAIKMTKETKRIAKALDALSGKERAATLAKLAEELGLEI